MTDKIPDPRGLHVLAYSQAGHFTARQATGYGFSRQLLAHHVESGRYERIRRGIYRLARYPGSSYQDVWVNWLAIGTGRAVVSHETALSIHDLSDVVPNAVHLLVARNDRGIKPPPGVKLHTTRALPSSRDVMVVEGLRVTTPARSIVDAAIAGTQPDQIAMAVGQALDRGVATGTELRDRASRISGGGGVWPLLSNSIKEGPIAV
ncbi:MAG: type IV toxin-antitoxin system AbiEi family antitoxin domain-containing protein [Solirubrobacterales bacterium]